jgi:pimeloyl-ACP methyl ester carboxylesterase
MVRELSFSKLRVRELELEAICAGEGPPMLLLHGGGGLDPNAPFLRALSERFRLIAPFHPGFGGSPRPAEIDTTDDLAYFYLDLLDQLNLKSVVLMGISFGGWIAAEIATKSTARLAKLILVDAVGIKVSNRETPDIADIFAIGEEELRQLMFHKPPPSPDFKSMSDDQIAVQVRNREALALYMWEPFAHNPKLRSRLHRVTVPTLVIWGASDRLVKPEYGRAYCAAIPGARFELIPEAGHAPQIEQPQVFVDRVLRFAL